MQEFRDFTLYLPEKHREIYETRICHTSPHHHIEDHHEHKADGETDGAEIGVLARRSFRKECLPECRYLPV